MGSLLDRVALFVLVHRFPNARNMLRSMTEVWWERKRQLDLGYTPEHDDQHTTGDFAGFIQKRLGPDGPASAGQAMVEIAALAMAALESMDRKAGRARR